MDCTTHDFITSHAEYHSVDALEHEKRAVTGPLNDYSVALSLGYQRVWLIRSTHKQLNQRTDTLPATSKPRHKTTSGHHFVKFASRSDSIFKSIIFWLK